MVISGSATTNRTSALEPRHVGSPAYRRWSTDRSDLALGSGRVGSPANWRWGADRSAIWRWGADLSAPQHVFLKLLRIKMLQLLFFKGLYLFIICLDIFRFMTRLDMSKHSIISTILVSDIRWTSRIRRHWVKSLYVHHNLV